jgi:rifampicin phosphotransferase
LSKEELEMSNEQRVPLVLALDDPAATLAQVGGKGASLARLGQSACLFLLGFTSLQLPIAIL